MSKAYGRHKNHMADPVYQRLLDLVADGASIPAAAETVGLTVKDVDKARYRDRYLDQALMRLPSERRERAQLNALRYIALGYTQPETAAIMKISQRTLTRYLTSISARLGAQGPTNAVAVAAASGLINIGPEGPMKDPTPGYEADSADVAAEVTAALDGFTDDLAARFARASAMQAHHRAVVHALANERARIAAELWAGGGPDSLSYDKIAALLGLGSRSTAQKLVERGRRVH